MNAYPPSVYTGQPGPDDVIDFFVGLMREMFPQARKPDAAFWDHQETLSNEEAFWLFAGIDPGWAASLGILAPCEAITAVHQGRQDGAQ